MFLGIDGVGRTSGVSKLRQSQPEMIPEAAKGPDEGPEADVATVGGVRDGEPLFGDSVPGVVTRESVHLRDATDYLVARHSA